MIDQTAQDEINEIRYLDGRLDKLAVFFPKKTIEQLTADERSEALRILKAFERAHKIRDGLFQLPPAA